jgi:hypothetical protein
MQSCKSQSQDDTISMNYKAQTRGFLYEIQVKKDTLTKISSSKTLKVKLNKKQISKLKEIIATIDFSKIKNNTNTEALAVDKAIGANFSITIKNETHTYQFIHKQLPTKIQELLNYLDQLE